MQETDAAGPERVGPRAGLDPPHRLRRGVAGRPRPAGQCPPGLLAGHPGAGLGSAAERRRVQVPVDGHGHVRRLRGHPARAEPQPWASAGLLLRLHGAPPSWAKRLPQWRGAPDGRDRRGPAHDRRNATAPSRGRAAGHPGDGGPAIGGGHAARSRRGAARGAVDPDRETRPADPGGGVGRRPAHPRRRDEGP